MHTSGVKHLAIIMDGNRRWAKEHQKPSLEGHRAGYDTLKRIGDAALNKGIEILTVYAFSSENWKRAEGEVGYLMDLLEFALKNELAFFAEREVRIRVLGRRDGLRASVLSAIERAEEETKNFTKGTLCLCINYGGRTEILDACKKVIQDGIPADQLTEEDLQSRLYWGDMPEPELMIRTSGEERVSGFLTWQSIYTELYWCPKHWPDFTEEDLDLAFEAYASRQRRFGA